MNGIYLSLGANLGNRLMNLREACLHLNNNGIKVLEESTIYETQPWGRSDQEWFLNLNIEIATSLGSNQLLDTLLEIETTMGRIRKEKWGKRMIDIDIIYYHDEIITTDNLTIPHPAIENRKFVLIPMTELNPFATHPKLKKNQMELLASCKDELACNPTEFKL